MLFNIQEELKKLPDKPGVYIMKDQNGEIIYIGKAVVLKNRVRQYFQASANHSPKVRAMVARIAEFEYIVTDTELEALILECNLIKNHRPRFNILLKDDKSYPYIKVTMNEEYPRIIKSRKLEKDGARYFGPYTNVAAVNETMDLLKKLFPVKSCKRVLPRDIGKERACLNYHIKRCLGPCCGHVDKIEYRQIMQDVCAFLSGRYDEIIEHLQIRMIKEAQNMNFEKAADLRDKLISIKYIAEKQKVISTAMEDQDIIAFAKDDTDSCIQVFFVRRGKLIGREHFILEETSGYDDSELITSFIKQFYSNTENIPGQIISQYDVDEHKIIERWLSDKSKARVHIRIPRRGEKLKLVEMVATNASLALKQFKDKIRYEGKVADEGLQSLKDLLALETIPKRIEAYDISNTGTTEIVASMVVFINGHPEKNEYKRFRIRSVSMQNDYGSMQEALFRRFKHAEKAGLTRYPDLLLVDGGLGHVNAARSVINEFNIDIPVYGMVKDDRHRTRGLVSQGGEIELGNHIQVLRLITSIQDEAHRFAVEYNRKLRSKRYSTSELDNIMGVGPRRKKALIKHFGSINKIKQANIDELMKIEGITQRTAESIYKYFNEQDRDL